MSKLLKALHETSKEQKLSCAKAFALVKKFDIALSDITTLCNQENIKLSACNLGLFHTDLSQAKTYTLTDVIKPFLSTHNTLACKDAYKVAKQEKIALKSVGKFANAHKIKITNCQLGCFSTRRNDADKK